MKNKPDILVHVCCADCALKLNLIDYTPTWYFDNSNIHPRSEYEARLRAVQQVAKQHNINLKIADWSPRSWYSAIKYDTDNTAEKRCAACWTLRLSNTAEMAKTLGMSSFTTTLLSSHYQNFTMLCKIGLQLSGELLSFVPTKRFTCDTKTSGFYKQNYCGCVYSLKERYEEKFLKSQGS